jgi:Xaa-Pro aminopeptidase
MSNIINIHERIKKNNDEINNIKFISEKTCLALSYIIKNIKKIKTEKEVEETIRTYMKNYKSAFPLICASGRNNSDIHYHNNNDKLSGLLLLDIGFYYNNYCCDIARTIPISGKYNYYESLLYNIIYELSNFAIKNIKLGSSIEELEILVREQYLHILLKLKFINLEDIKLTYLFMPHRLGHSIGIDIHDLEFTKFENNVVFTIEPGIYFQDKILKDININKVEVLKYWDIGGIRIEDMICIENNTINIISNEKFLPKSLNNIESFII